VFTGLKKILAPWINIHPELKISLVIGLLLLGVSGSILFTLFTGSPRSIERPLVTGIFFLMFSGGSYLLYRVQTGVGTEENSAALQADGMHSRADMVISLLTAFSLLTFYYLGINLDRYMGGITALIILVFALEILINSWVCLAGKRQEYLREYTSTHIAGALLDHRLYSSLVTGIFKRCFPSRQTEVYQIRAAMGNMGKWCGFLVLTALVIGYLSTCLYMVNTGQRGLKLRFGRIVNKEMPDLPGLHLKFPWPVDTTTLVDTEKIRTLPVGNRIVDQNMLLWSREHGDNCAFISGDNNLFLPYAGVHYRIKDSVAYYLYPKNPEKIIKSITWSLLTHAFSSASFYSLALKLFSSMSRIFTPRPRFPRPLKTWWQPFRTRKRW